MAAKSQTAIGRLSSEPPRAASAGSAHWKKQLHAGHWRDKLKKGEHRRELGDEL